MIARLFTENSSSLGGGVTRQDWEINVIESPTTDTPLHRPFQEEVLASDVTSRLVTSRHVTSCHTTSSAQRFESARKRRAARQRTFDTGLSFCISAFILIIAASNAGSRGCIIRTVNCVVSVWWGGDSEKTIPQRAGVVQLCV